MLRGLRTRMAVAYGTLMVLCVGALTIYLVFVGQDTYLETLQSGVEAQARMVGVATVPYLTGPWRVGEIDALAKKLGQQSGTRVTIIDRAGVVLGDSESDPTTMENHATRPEVAMALGGEVGRSE